MLEQVRSARLVVHPLPGGLASGPSPAQPVTEYLPAPYKSSMTPAPGPSMLCPGCVGFKG